MEQIREKKGVTVTPNQNSYIYKSLSQRLIPTSPKSFSFSIRYLNQIRRDTHDGQFYIKKIRCITNVCNIGINKLQFVTSRY